MQLDAQQLKAFDEQGYIFIPNCFADEEVALMRAIGREQIFYIPDMIADHIIPRERICIDWFRKRVFWQAISDVLAGVDMIEFDAALVNLRDLAGLSKKDQDVLMRIQYQPHTADEVRKHLALVYQLTYLMSEGLPKLASWDIG